MSGYSESSKVQNDNVLLFQRTRARLQREVFNLIKNPPEGVFLVVDSETGLPQSLNEIVVRLFISIEIITAVSRF
jgi:hypothetical protein